MQVEDIRTVMIDGEKWYVGIDVASALGYKDLRKPLRYHVDNEDKKKYKISTNTGKHDTTIINKHGFESLLSSSQKPSALDIAKKFNISVTPLNIYKVKDIRTVMIDGEKWYVGIDIAKALGYVNTSGAIRSHVDNEDKEKYKILINNNPHDAIIINKHGLEVLISSSIMPNTINIAEKFNIKVNKIWQKFKKVKGIRTVMIDGEQWYVGIDVAKALGYKEASSAVQYHVDDKDKKSIKISTNNKIQDRTIINKHGLEQFVSSSTMPNTISIAKTLNIQLNYMLDTYRGQNIRNIIIDGKLWFASKDVVKILGYKDPREAINHYINKEDRIKIVVRSGNQNCKMILTNKHGLEGLLSKSTMPNAINIAAKLGINVNHILNTRKEQDSIHAILKAFKGENMVRQYKVGTYRIDLYFPKYKLAIECDEFGHSDRDQEYEQTRQYYIEDKLGCKFIRYNPDSKNYNIFNVLNRIYKEMSK